jgi:diacylglycerol kinase (ATP)
LGIAAIVTIFGIIFKVSLVEWAILFLTMGLVIACELINTAIEATVDLVTEDYHPLAKVAKDTSAAAVFIFAIVAVLVGMIIFLPKIISIVF